MNLSLKLTAVALVALPFASPRPSRAAFGPPLLCHQFAIGDARSLPWGSGTEGRRGYDRTRLVADVAEILKTEQNLIVRMETLRRAALYTRGDRALAWELLGRTGLAVLEESAIAGKEATAWFDIGFLTACLHQAEADLGVRAGVAENQEGLAYLLRALDRAHAEGADQVATIEFATALVIHPLTRSAPTAKDIEGYERHLETARAGAPQGSLLARNLEEHEKRFDVGKAGWVRSLRKTSDG